VQGKIVLKKLVLGDVNGVGMVCMARELRARVCLMFLMSIAVTVMLDTNHVSAH